MKSNFEIGQWNCMCANNCMYPRSVLVMMPIDLGGPTPTTVIPPRVSQVMAVRLPVACGSDLLQVFFYAQK